jgi:hypothetical protein
MQWAALEVTRAGLVGAGVAVGDERGRAGWSKTKVPIKLDLEHTSRRNWTHINPFQNSRQRVLLTDQTEVIQAICLMGLTPRRTTELTGHPLRLLPCGFLSQEK